MLFDFTFEIPDIMCTACTDSIISALRKHLESKNIIHGSITEDVKQKTVSILFLNVKDEQEALTLAEELKGIIDSVGFSCKNATIKNHSKISPNLSISKETEGHKDIESQITTPLLSQNEQAENESSKPLSTENSYGAWLKPTFSLAPGIGLMIAEHLGKLPGPAVSEEGLYINLAIGSVSTLITGYMGYPHFKNAWRMQGAMDTLISLGSLFSLADSWATILYPPFFGGKEAMTHFSLPLVILGFLQLSHALRDSLQHRIKQHTDVLKEETNQLPKTVQHLSADNQLFAASVYDISPGETIIVSPGEVVPIDSTLLNETPVWVKESFYGKKGDTEKNKDHMVYAGTINTSNQTLYLKTQCEAVNNHITQAYLALSNRPSSSPAIEWVSRYFLLGVLAIDIISALAWGLCGPEPRLNNAINTSIAILLSACPCGIGLIPIIPSMIKSLAIQEGILIRKDNCLEKLPHVTNFLFDKCGTLTTGEYAYAGILGLNEPLDENTLLNYAQCLESQIPEKERSAVARAFLKKGNATSLLQCTYFEDNPFNHGRGGKGQINGNSVIIGNKELLKHYGISISSTWEELEAKQAQKGFLPIYLAVNGNIECLFLLQSVEEHHQTIRPEVKSAIERLQAQGKTIHIVTGDTEERTQSFLNENGLSDITIHSKQTPSSKADLIRQLQDQNKVVAFCGDDKNDSPATQQADVSIAIDLLAATCHEADATLNGSLAGLAKLMVLARTYQESYHTALVLAFGLNALSLITAAGAFYPITQGPVDPLVPSMAMVSSSLLLMISIAIFQQIGKYRCQNALNPSRSWCGFNTDKRNNISIEKSTDEQKSLEITPFLSGQNQSNR